jgi:uncharacterized protein DUF222/HNH endonuclease
MGIGRKQRLIQSMDALNAGIGVRQRDLLRFIAEADRTEVWVDSGAHDMAHWLLMRYGISYWKAARWIACAHALEDLPLISEALASGALGIDKVVELTRFATPQTERKLIPWAQSVSCGAIRDRGDLVLRQRIEEVRDAEDSRFLRWGFFDQGRRFALSAELSAADGAVVAKAIDRLAERVPVMPGEEGPSCVEARRADALVGMCSGQIASDPDPDRATVIIHAQLDGLLSGTGGAEVEDGPIIHPHTARRLACHARVQTVLEDEKGNPLRLGRMRREPTPGMLRLIKQRDRECTFPGCGARRFTQAHHIRWWEHGGRTDVENLVLICSFHHKLVHEYGWRLIRDRDGTVRWFHPDGRPYRAGPAPPRELVERQPVLSAVGV